MATPRPSLAAATAWLAPLPPGLGNRSPPDTVSPGPGSAETRTTRSRFRLPTTATAGAVAEPAGCRLIPASITRTASGVVQSTTCTGPWWPLTKRTPTSKAPWGPHEHARPGEAVVQARAAR
jgi:hypothetical protein